MNLDAIFDKDQRELDRRAQVAQDDYQALRAKSEAAIAARDKIAAERKSLEARIADMLADAHRLERELADALGAEALGGPKVTAKAYSEAAERIARLRLGASGIASTALESANRAEHLADAAIGQIGISLDVARTRAGTYASGEVDLAAWRQAERAAKGLQVG